MSRSVVRALLGCLLVATLAAPLAGCRSSRPGAPASYQPSNLPVESVVITLHTESRALDADENGFLDSVLVTVFLYTGDVGRYPQPFFAEGEFRFIMLAENSNEVLGRWNFDEAEARAREGNNPFGDSYTFSISLLNGGVSRDRVRLQAARLYCAFVPTSGEPRRSAPGVVVVGG